MKIKDCRIYEHIWNLIIDADFSDDKDFKALQDYLKTIKPESNADTKELSIREFLYLMKLCRKCELPIVMLLDIDPNETYKHMVACQKICVQIYNLANILKEYSNIDYIGELYRHFLYEEFGRVNMHEIYRLMHQEHGDSSKLISKIDDISVMGAFIEYKHTVDAINEWNTTHNNCCPSLESRLDAEIRGLDMEYFWAEYNSVLLDDHTDADSMMNVTEE